jgi:small-conductance mechanosensitive channel
MNEMISNIPEALIIIGFFYLLSLFLDRLLHKFSDHFDTGASEIFRLLSNSQKALLLLIAAIMAIGKLGFDVSALVAGLGLSGFALGFALKDAISNLIAGVMIVIYKPCQIGDLIEISGTKGQITDINLRYVTISTDSGKCLIPNSLILNNKLSLHETES